MKEELIDHITQQLKQYEAPYSDGAWERFSQKKKKRRIAYWPIWSAVAVLIISAGLYFNYNSEKNIILTDKHTQTPIVKTPKPFNNEENLSPINSKNKLITPYVKIDEKVIRNTTLNKVLQSKTLESKYQEDDHYVENFIKNESSESLKQENQFSNMDNKTLQQTDSKETIKQQEKKPIEKQSFEQLLAKDSSKDKNSVIVKNQKSKWQPELYVAPTIGNDEKMNISYGFSISYALADKLSIGTGLAYNNLSSNNEQNINNTADAPTYQASALISSRLPVETSKTLESVKAQVRGITIPLDLKYNINDKLYTSVGVSALAVINNNQKNNYLVSTVENKQIVNVAGIAENKTLISTQTITETAQTTELSTDKYIGFYNFSIGYKQKISKKNNIAIEPFLALPMKNANKDLNLTNGGFKLKLNF
jgi:hypothetical protein